MPIGASRAKGCPFPSPAKGFQSRQGRAQGSCRESEGVCRWLGELNKASAVTRITGNQTLLRASYRITVEAKMPPVCRRWLPVVTQKHSSEDRVSQSSMKALEGGLGTTKAG